MLKKRSSRQVLPSRSRKLWWQLFLWSHRSLHRPGASAAMPPAAGRVGAAIQRDGYTSDTLDAATATDAKNKGVAVEEGPVPSQWVAFAADASSLDRVSAWVNSLGHVSFHGVDEDDDVVTARGHDDDDGGAGAARPQCSEIVELPAAGKRQAKRRAADEAAQASGVVQTLNTFSSVAHISGMGLKAIPFIAAFSTLRTVNLSGNLIGNS